jgi:hypothetical protein
MYSSGDAQVEPTSCTLARGGSGGECGDHHLLPVSPRLWLSANRSWGCWRGRGAGSLPELWGMDATVPSTYTQAVPAREGRMEGEAVSQLPPALPPGHFAAWGTACLSPGLQPETFTHVGSRQPCLLHAAWLEAAQTSMNHAAIKDEEAAL